jgi:hypothetical protein
MPNTIRVLLNDGSVEHTSLNGLSCASTLPIYPMSSSMEPHIMATEKAINFLDHTA